MRRAERPRADGNLGSVSVSGVPRTRVLVVEDDPYIASAVALELEHDGYEPRVVDDGPAALVVWTEWGPDLVLLALGLPTLDGVEVCRRIRAASHTPVVVLTARGTVEDRVRGLD